MEGQALGRMDSREEDVTRRSLGIKTNPALLRLLEECKGTILSKEDRAAQRKSWVVGEMMLAHPNLTRKEAEAIYKFVIEE